MTDILSGASKATTDGGGKGTSSVTNAITYTGPAGAMTFTGKMTEAWKYVFSNGAVAAQQTSEKNTIKYDGVDPYTGANVTTDEQPLADVGLTSPPARDWFEAASNFAAAMGDKVSGGVTRRIRQKLGYDDVVSYNSRAYQAGAIAGEVINVGVQNLTPCRFVGLMRTGVRAVQGAQAVGNTFDAADAFSAGDAVGGLASLQGAMSSFGTLLRACFRAGTPLLVNHAGESKAIELFQAGDLILSRSEHDPAGPLALRRVLQVFVRVSPVLDLYAGGCKIGTTGEHPFYVAGRGWIPAGMLEAGDELLNRDGKRIPVEGVVDSGRVETVYNLEVEEDHTYFVGCNEWGFDLWSHNAEYRRVVGAAELHNFQLAQGFTPKPGHPNHTLKLFHPSQQATTVAGLRDTKVGKKSFTHIIAVQVDDAGLAAFRQKHGITEVATGGHPGSLEIPQALIPEFNQLITAAKAQAIEAAKGKRRR